MIDNNQEIKGTLVTNLLASQRVTDSEMGKSASGKDEKNRLIRWIEIGVDENKYNKIDFQKSSIGLDINYGYGDNSGDGNFNHWDKDKEFKVDKFWNSGKLEYNDDRHHGGGGRSTDHQWKYSLGIDAEGISIWDWVWVWANGNWGNKAASEADITIKSVSYNFKLTQ